MRAQPVDLIGGFYTDDTLPWACQDTLNWLPFAAEVSGTRTQWKLSTAPGLKPYQQIGTGPIRGMHDLEGGRFVVSGRYLFRISNTGVGVPIGVIPGVGRVSMTHNQFGTGYQLLVENGEGGGGYVYTSATGAFAKITDPAYPGSISSDYLDSFGLGVEPLGRYWFTSNLADFTDYNSLDRYESEASPDRIVGLAVSQFEVVVFNQRTIEFFYNSGAATGTFQNRRQSIAQGCASRHTIAKLDNTLFWLGDDGVVYRLNGYSAQPISTRVIDRAIADFDWSEALAFTWEDRGHKVYYLTFPNGLTFGYDVVTGLWTRRGSYGIDRWRLSHTVSWGGKWYGGDFQDGRIWEINWDYFLEGSDPLVRRRRSPVLADNQSAIVIPFAELVFGTGEGPMTEPLPFPAQPPFPTLTGNAPDNILNVLYTPFTYGIVSGQAPFTVALTGGALPPGLSISTAGQITGTPTAIGNYSYTLRVTDALGLWTERTDDIGITVQVLALGNSGVTNLVTRRGTSGAWTTVSTAAAAASGHIQGLASGRFVAWLAGAAYYSDDNGGTWTQSATSIDSTGGTRNGDSLGTVVAMGGGGGAFYVSTNGGTTYTPRTAPNTFLGRPLIVKAGASVGRILLLHTQGGFNNSYTDDQGVTFTNAPAHGVNLTTGLATFSVDDLQFIGGIVAAGGRPMLAVMRSGNTLVRNLTLSLAAVGYISALCRYTVGGVSRLLMGTSTGELWRSEDDGVTSTRLTGYAATTQITGIVYDGVRVIVSRLGTGDVIQSSLNNGGTWAPETNTNTSGVRVMGGTQ